MKILMVVVMSFFASVSYSADCVYRGSKGNTAKNFISALEANTTWYHPNSSTYSITFKKPGVFYIDYNGQAKNAARQIVITGKRFNGKFKGKMVIGGQVEVPMKEIYFVKHPSSGLCSLVTRTEPSWYTDESNAAYKAGSKDLAEISTGPGGVQVSRQYQWVKELY